MGNELRYLGQIGSYSHVCALAYQNKANLNDYQLNSFPSITDIIINKPTQNKTLLVLPLENSTSGDVYETYKQIYEYGLNVVDSYTLKIEHTLIALKDSDTSLIKKVYSHPQALLQVTNYLKNNNIISIPDFSTSDAVNKVANSNQLDIAAVGPKELINYYPNLKIINSNISNHENNFTRFLITIPIATKEKYQVNINNNANDASIFLLFSLHEDQAGSLTNVLNIISTFNINLFSIKSRPIEGKSFEYFFIIEGKINTKDINNYHESLSKKLKEETASFTYNIY